MSLVNLVSLRWRLTAYLIAAHAIFAALAVYLLYQERLWLFAVELVFAVSILTGLSLTRTIFRGFRLAPEGAQLIREHEFTSRFLDVGQPEIDALIAVYNRMVDHLRDERARLQEQHYFLSRILQVSPLAIVTLDFDDRITMVNPSAERLLAQPDADLQGLRVAELSSPLAETLASLEPGASRVVALHGARRVKCHRGTFIDRGFPRTFLLLEELTEELRQFEKAAYEKLIRVMSHEVNNTVGASNSLLHSCLTYARELSAESRTDFEPAIGVVIARTEQLNRFMRSFADVVRLPAPIRERQALTPLLRDIARLFSRESAERNIRWVWDVDSTPDEVAIDRGQIEQALVNVCKNAIEAVDRDGEIAVRLWRQQGRLTLAIEDSGPGVTPEARANLFTPFFSTKAAGQGIGLTLVQEILSQHQCEYSLDSRQDGARQESGVAAGEPTRFTIVFPS